MECPVGKAKEATEGFGDARTEPDDDAAGH